MGKHSASLKTCHTWKGLLYYMPSSAHFLLFIKNLAFHPGCRITESRNHLFEPFCALDPAYWFGPLMNNVKGSFWRDWGVISSKELRLKDFLSSLCSLNLRMYIFLHSSPCFSPCSSHAFSVGKICYILPQDLWTCRSCFRDTLLQAFAWMVLLVLRSHKKGPSWSNVTPLSPTCYSQRVH